MSYQKKYIYFSINKLNIFTFIVGVFRFFFSYRRSRNDEREKAKQPKSGEKQLHSVDKRIKKNVLSRMFVDVDWQISSTHNHHARGSNPAQGDIYQKLSSPNGLQSLFLEQ